MGVDRGEDIEVEVVGCQQQCRNGVEVTKAMGPYCTHPWEHVLFGCWPPRHCVTVQYRRSDTSLHHPASERLLVVLFAPGHIIPAR